MTFLLKPIKTISNFAQCPLFVPMSKNTYVDLAFLEKIIPVNFFWTAFGQNALESFILKGFGTLVIGFESRTGHQ